MSGPTYLQTMVQWLRAPALLSTGIAVLASGLLYFKQNDVIYPRNIPENARTEVPKPHQFKIEHSEELSLRTPDEVNLHAFLIRPNAQHARNITIISFHGNAGNIGHRLPIAKVLSEDLGCNVLFVEYRGYGYSSGEPNEKGLGIDAQTALDYVRNRKDLRDTKIIIYGQSLGGAVAIGLVGKNQSQGDIAGLILENTFMSIRTLIPSVLPPAKYLTLLCHQLWPSNDVIPTIKKVPILFLSGLQDEIVPASHMKGLYDACVAEKKIWKAFPEGSHNDTIAEPGYFDAIEDFIVNEVLDEGEKSKSAL
ncbi:BEM46 family protein [Microthyrium microscopicum]|uniref:BEM46 family protein n=1 Tax=Microthyrium microscopicum TaxID=703497 RepID=A0A6A6UHX0_9PEZI|nr:BEM46 family protein [Microthyrium microscopicum]